jgi:uncharacterized protein YdhG (YjbR/CyaY superfamily)
VTVHVKRSPEIDAYLAPLPEPQRAALEHLREVVAAAAPEAEEAISYAMPALRYRGRFVVSYLAAKRHLSLFARLYDDEDHRAVELFKALKGTLRFSPEQPIPDDVVTRLVRGRIAELDALPVAKSRERRA